MASSLSPLPLGDHSIFDTPEVWRSLTKAHRYLAELKGLCESLPNPSLLIDTLSIQEAKDSSEIENIITTHDELYGAAEADSALISPAAKEVKHNAAALRVGFDEVEKDRLIRLSTVLAVQGEIEQNRAGLRQVPGTVLRNEATGETIYEPPQSAVEVASLMDNLIEFIHADDDLDPLVRTAIAHHQFESIHPFYDGNGRTGRIFILLMLQREGLLDLPVLYLSRYITTHKADYYRLLQTVRDENRWPEWCVYLTRGIADTARSGIELVKNLRDLMQRYKHEIREQLPKIYRQELLNNLFRHPYTKIEFVQRELGVSRPTATKYLDLLHTAGFVRKKKVGRSNFYINEPLFALLSNIILPNS